jgi:hypothetical protein
MNVRSKLNGNAFRVEQYDFAFKVEQYDFARVSLRCGTVVGSSIYSLFFALLPMSFRFY